MREWGIKVVEQESGEVTAIADQNKADLFEENCSEIKSHLI